LHGGSIRAQSEGLGMGALFTIDLPTEAPGAPGAEEAPPSEAPRQGRLRLLVVEDHPGTAAAIEQMLTAAGFDLSVTGSTAGAMALVERGSFDLLISDIGLPDASGYELMRRVQEVRPMPGIAMSGYGMAEDIAKSREAGFAEHLVKPVDVSQLERAIRQV